MADNVTKLQKDFEEKAKTIADRQEDFLRTRFKDSMDILNSFDPSSPDFQPIEALLSIPDKDFVVLSDFFLDEIERSFKNSNDAILIAQSMNLQGLKAEDMQLGFQELISQMDSEELEGLSDAKKDFLKKLFMILSNVISETEGISKKIIQIPIEFVNEDAKMPTYAHAGDAGMDVYAIEDVELQPGEQKIIPVGFKVAIPHGYELQVRPRSGLSSKTKLRIANAPGTIDSGYRGEVGIICENIASPVEDLTFHYEGEKLVIDSIVKGRPISFEKGERIAQLVLNEVPIAAFQKVDSVSGIEEDRNGGFGSTGK